MAQLMLAMGTGAGAMSTLSAVSTVAGAVLPVMEALQKGAERREQAGELERSAIEKRVMAGIEAAKVRREGRFRQSRDLVSMAEGGVLSGTSYDVLDQNAVMRELDALTVEFQGEQAGKADDFRAGQYRKSNVLNVFSAAVEGFSSMDPLNLRSDGGA